MAEGDRAMDVSSPAAVAAPAEALLDVGQRVLRAVGVPVRDAAIVAGALIDADVRGLHSHGLLRLPLYVNAVEAGGIVPDVDMGWSQPAPAVAALDAGFGFGHVAMEAATSRAAELATAHGTGLVTVRRSTHFGAGVSWALPLVERGMVALIASTTGPAVAPHGGCEPVLGTNPLTIALPVDGGDPIVLDMATSAAAYGKVVAARQAGESIPQGWAVDAQGRETTDPVAALAGSLLAFGGHKGSGLAVVVEGLAGALAGARFGYETTDIWVDPASQMGTGHVVWVIDASAVNPATPSRVGQLATRITSTAPADGVDEVLVPGALEARRARHARERGIALPTEILGALCALADRLGVPWPAEAPRTSPPANPATSTDPTETEEEEAR